LPNLHPQKTSRRESRPMADMPKKVETTEAVSDGESTDSWFSIPTPSSRSRSPTGEDSTTEGWRPAVVSTSELDEIYAELEEKWGRCVGLYVHGSTIFANHVPQDLDLIAVVEEPKHELAMDSPDSQFTLGRCEVSVYAKECFLQKLEQMDLTMLTCLNTPERFVLKRLEDPRVTNLKIDLDLLEASVISYAVFTWRKFQRVLDEWKDPYKSSKNAYFVFRVMQLGCQLAQHGCIQDLKAANGKWDVVRRVFEDLRIQPGDSQIVEAVLSRDFLLALRHFQEEIAKAKGEGPGPVRSEAEAVLDTCAVCLEPRADRRVAVAVSDDAGDAGDDFRDAGMLSSTGWVRLVNCRHCFHASCIAESLRARPDLDFVCPMCRASVRIDGSSDPNISKWFREPKPNKRSRYSYAGYPATLRVRQPTAPMVEATRG